MALYATTVVMMGPSPDGVGVFPRSYISSAGSEKEAERSAVQTEKRVSPDRILYASATDRIADRDVREAHTKGNSGALAVTGLVTMERTGDGTVMRAVNHVSTGDPGVARQAAIDDSWKSHPERQVLYTSSATATAATLNREVSAIGAEPSLKGSAIGDVEKYATEAVNRYRQAVLDQDQHKARTATVYTMSREAADAKMSVGASVVISSAAIDAYVGHRRAGVAHAEARGSAARQVAHRLDGMGNERTAKVAKSRGHDMSL